MREMKYVTLYILCLDIVPGYEALNVPSVCSDHSEIGSAKPSLEVQ